MTPTQHKPLSTSVNTVKVKEQKAIKLWILRILITMDGNNKFLGRHYFDSNEIATFLGLQKFAYDEYDYKEAHKKIFSMHQLLKLM